ncbi:MAG: response regulator [Nitrospirota bacterium]
MKTVLIVDADSGSSGIEEVLQRRGFRGIAASNALEALAIIRKDPSIALVVTEMQFPDMDGLHFLINLRAIAPGVPIIVVTSCGSIESYLHAVNLGVYEYLNKPVPPKELVRIASIALAGPWTVPPMRDAQNRQSITDPALLLRGGAAEIPDR